MNTRHALITLLVTLVAATSPVVQAGSKNTTAPTVVRVSAVTRDDTPVVSIGSTDSAVLTELGSPFLKYADNVWVYPNYRGSGDSPIVEQCTMLVITFDNDRVASLGLMNPKAAKIVASKAQTDPGYLNRRIVAMK